MRLLILLLLFLPMSCQPAYGNEPAPKYNSFYLFQWIANCAQALHPMLMRQGYPEGIAIRESAAQCSCIVDGFRKNFTMEETQNLSIIDRRLFSHTYAQECTGIKL